MTMLENSARLGPEQGATLTLRSLERTQSSPRREAEYTGAGPSVERQERFRPHQDFRAEISLRMTPVENLSSHVRHY
jgi:hypothetical protein